MKAFLAVLLSLLTVTGDVSFTGYLISGQNSGNTDVYAQDVHILHEETAERDAKQEVEEDTASGSEEQEADAGAGYRAAPCKCDKGHDHASDLRRIGKREDQTGG